MTRNFQEVHKSLGKARSTIYGWERDILCKIKPEHILNQNFFTEEEFECMWMICFYKELKYSNDAIIKLFNDSNFDKNKLLDESIVKLTKLRDELDRILNVATLMKEANYDSTVIKFFMISENETSYVYSMNYMNILYQVSKTIPFDDDVFYADDADFESFLETMKTCFDRCSNLLDKGVSSKSYEAINAIKEFHENNYYHVSSMKVIFYMFVNGIIDSFLDDDDFNSESKVFIYMKESLDTYIHEKDECAEKLENILEEIICLAYSKKTYKSLEVQQKVNEFNNSFNTKLFGKEFNAYILKLYIALFNHSDFRKLINDTSERGRSWFVAKAFETFYKNNFVNKNAKEEE